MSIAQNLAAVNERISQAARSAGRDPSEVRLVAVTKTMPPETVFQALAAGQTIFGENYVQESVAKISCLGPAPQWHFIGHLQSNKAKLAAAHFNLIQTVDRIKLAKALSRHAQSQSKTLGILLQVNLGGEGQKSGCKAQEAAPLAQAVAALPGLELQGLMTMPPFWDDPGKVRPIFAKLRKLAFELQSGLPPGAMEQLSMGMTGDFEAAIQEGATMVRVGTAIFGGRNYA